MEYLKVMATDDVRIVIMFNAISETIGLILKTSEMVGPKFENFRMTSKFGNSILNLLICYDLDID